MNQPAPNTVSRRLHMRYYLTSAVNTLWFYGTAVLISALFPVLVCLVICLFFSRFYRKEIRQFLTRPIRTLFRIPPPGDGKIDIDVLPPGNFPSTVD